MYNLTLLLRIGLGGGRRGQNGFPGSPVVRTQRLHYLEQPKKKKWKYTLNAKTKNVVKKKKWIVSPMLKGFSEKNSFLIYFLSAKSLKVI